MVISYAETIMKPSASILHTKYVGSTAHFLSHVQTNIAAGLYFDHKVYSLSGDGPVVSKQGRDGKGTTIPDDFNESLASYTMAYNYAHEHFNMKPDDTVLLTESSLYVNYPGSGLILHTDDHALGLDGTTQIGVDMHRCITLLVYLNDDFEGGAIHFPDQAFRIKPQAGTMIMFPSNKKFMHTVEPIISGNRYAYQRMYGIASARSGAFTE